MDRNVFKTELYWNTTNEFAAVDSSLSFIAETSTSVTGLLPETAYYFKLITYGTNGFIRFEQRGNFHRKPSRNNGYRRNNGGYLGGVRFVERDLYIGQYNV
jgi:hypothetical protein